MPKRGGNPTMGPWPPPGGWPKPKLGTCGHGCMALSTPRGPCTHVRPVWRLGAHNRLPHSTWAQKPAELQVQKTLPKHKSSVRIFTELHMKFCEDSQLWGPKWHFQLATVKILHSCKPNNYEYPNTVWGGQNLPKKNAKRHLKVKL